MTNIVVKFLMLVVWGIAIFLAIILFGILARVYADYVAEIVIKKLKK